MTDIQSETFLPERRKELVTRLKTCGKGLYRNLLITELESVIISEILLEMVRPAITKEEDAYAVVFRDQDGKNVFVLPMQTRVHALQVASDLRAWMRNALEKMLGVYGSVKDEIQLKE